MKKLLIIIVIFQAILISLNIYILVNHENSYSRTVINDTTINKVQIDSIHLLITKQESIINRINLKEKYELEKAINSNDSDVIKLFKELVTK